MNLSSSPMNFSSSPMNSSSSLCPWRDMVEEQAGKHSRVLECCILAICILTILANLLLAWLILNSRKLRQQRCSHFILSIGLADMANSLFLLVFAQPGINQGRLISVLSSKPNFCLAFNILGNFLLCAPWYNFLGLNLERLYGIKRPFAYNSMLKGGVSKTIASCWLFALLPALPLWTDTTLAEDFTMGCKCFYPLRNTLWVVWSSCIAFLLPTALILLSWAVMAHHCITQGNNGNNRLLVPVTVKLGLMTGLFLLGIAPFSTVFARTALQMPSSTQLLDITLPLALLQSMVQPILYICISSSLRAELTALLTGGSTNSRPCLGSTTSRPCLGSTNSRPCLGLTISRPCFELQCPPE